MISLLKNLIRYARISMSGSDSGNYPIQRVDFMGLENDAYVLFPYGMHGNVPADKLGLLFITNGNNEAKVVIPTSGDADRIKDLPEGEVVFFHPPTKSKIHFKANGDIEIVSTGIIHNESPDTIEDVAPTITLSGTDITISGTGTINLVGPDVNLGENTLRKLIDDRFAAHYDAHFHNGFGPGFTPSNAPTTVANVATNDTEAS